LSALFEIFVQDIVPILIVIGLGFAFARRTHPELRTLTRTDLLYLQSLPGLCVAGRIEHRRRRRLHRLRCLSSPSPGDGRAGNSISARLRLTPRQTAGFVLAVTFVNAGNYGLGVNRLAFGPEVESRAVIYFVVSSVLVYTGAC
jgi:hypothetical protein